MYVHETYRDFKTRPVTTSWVDRPDPDPTRPIRTEWTITEEVFFHRFHDQFVKEKLDTRTARSSDVIRPVFHSISRLRIPLRPPPTHVAILSSLYPHSPPFSPSQSSHPDPSSPSEVNEPSTARLDAIYRSTRPSAHAHCAPAILDDDALWRIEIRRRQKSIRHVRWRHRPYRSRELWRV